MRKPRYRPNRFETETLETLCRKNDCGIETFIDALYGSRAAQIAIAERIKRLKAEKDKNP